MVRRALQVTQVQLVLLEPAVIEVPRAFLDRKAQPVHPAHPGHQVRRLQETHQDSRDYLGHLGRPDSTATEVLPATEVRPSPIFWADC